MPIFNTTTLKAFSWTTTSLTLLAVTTLCVIPSYAENYAPSFAAPLIQAAHENDLEKVQLLLGRGADPNIRGEFNVTALMRAAHVGNEEMVALLLEHGADPNFLDLGGKDASGIARRAGHDSVLIALQVEPGSILIEDDEVGTTVSDEIFVAEHQVPVQTVQPVKPPPPITLASNKSANQLYDEFYGEGVTSGLYGHGARYDRPASPHKRAKTLIATEAVAVDDKGSQSVQILVHGYRDKQDLEVRFNDQISKFYFSSKEYRVDANELTVTVQNHFSKFQAKRTCARFTRRYPRLFCEII